MTLKLEVFSGSFTDMNQYHFIDHEDYKTNFRSLASEPVKYESNLE